jgi:hypothetical protein
MYVNRPIVFHNVRYKVRVVRTGKAQRLRFIVP